MAFSFLFTVFFSFLHFSFLLFEKYMSRKFFLQNYTSSAVGDGGRDLPPCPTTLRTRAVL
jgi:hypothetical protein